MDTALAATTSLLDQVLDERSLFDAWERVQHNDGCPGQDGESIARFAINVLGRLQQLKGEVHSGQYRPMPLQAIPVRKSGGGIRTLAVPSVRDRVLQTAVARVLGGWLEPQFDDASYAYRPGRSVAMAIQRVCQHRDAGLRKVVDADIRSYFDCIDHALLLQQLDSAVPNLGELRELIVLWLAADLRGNSADAARLVEQGVPQGSPLSPLLANLYLTPFDRAMRAAGHALVRYADDFVILCQDAIAAKAALADARAQVQLLRLELHADKTRLADFDRGFVFLGVRFVHRLAEAVDPAAARWLERLAGPAQRVNPPGHQTSVRRPPRPGPVTATGRELRSMDPALDDADPDDVCIGKAPDRGFVPRPPLLQTLYVGEHGVMLSKEHDRVVVSRRREVLKSVPLGQLDQIAVMANAMVSTALLRACAERRIGVAFSGPGEGLAAIDRGGLADQQIVSVQWQAQASDELRLLFARQFIEGKLHNCRTLLRRFSRREGKDAVQAAVLGLDDCQHRLASAADLNTLRGLEGGGARHYFSGLRGLLPDDVEFPARQRRPPPDPVNAMLSLGYSVLQHNMHTLVRLQGLNPHLGHLHRTAPGSLALVSDLVEEFRAPVVDAVVMTLLRQGEVRPGDFELGDGSGEWPCRMRTEPRRRFVAALESKLDSSFVHPRLGMAMDYRRAMQAQVRHYLDALARVQAVYQPLKLR